MRDDGKLRGRRGTLEVVCVNNRTRLGLQTFVADIADDADHVQQPNVAIHIAELKLAADWIFVRPKTARHRLTNHANVRRVRSVRIQKEPAPNERDPHSRKISGAGNAKIGVASFPRPTQGIELANERRNIFCWVRAIFDDERPVRAGAAHGQSVRAADGNHTWQTSETLKELLVKLRQSPLLRRLLRSWQRDRHGHGTFGVEAGIHFHEALEATA